jgi:hypothetical protein
MRTAKYVTLGDVILRQSPGRNYFRPYEKGRDLRSGPKYPAIENRPSELNLHRERARIGCATRDNGHSSNSLPLLQSSIPRLLNLSAVFFNLHNLD